ncbi:AsmA-like C-terminal region-containing protein [Aestuariibaculum suncheonense]|uniref:AsmA-like C-terminal region-containing protein n=1 Tax=Aestuariibaculum suncheonense TaxID=1028745 RepID=A0A8J6QAX8_9FLAO|nr:AsmA-like C-terminal region-containing protein [Aestuariibaculum suncheonense]MBD0836260.1 AsmA-like C-terminal region-containing protein [Aestuariibaculum suncheonense]
MKKAFKILGLSVLIILVLLIALPFAFKGQIKDMVKTFINQNINARVEFSDVSLSLLKSFPQAHVEVNDLLITNFEPFKDQTLLSTKNMAFTMSVKELFKSAEDGPLTINSISIDEAFVNLKTNAEGKSNYDITKDDGSTTETETSSDSSFAFDIENYSINNSAFNYLDEGSKIQFSISELNHKGKGTFSGTVSELDTNTEALVSFSMDSTAYLTNNHIKLDALIDLDIENSKYTFKDNKALINQLPLEFHGFVQLIEEGQDIDITFENPGSTFKDFLAVIPANYSKSIENVQTTGDFKVKGIIKGKVTEETIPTLDISITSNNASFKYPDLPKSVENIIINTEIKNETGYVDDTYVNINTLNFKIDNDIFKSSATIKNLTKNMLVNASVDGTLNLGNLTQAYPLELDQELSGILKANIHTAFDMNAIETNAYERIKSSGTMSVSEFKFASQELANPVSISKADMTFNPSTVTLNNFNATTGSSDINANGSINNLLGFLLSDGTLKGNFNVNSNNFVLSDFMTADEETPAQEQTETTTTSTASNTETLKIPAFLDCTINANAANVTYDNLKLKDVKGALVIKDQQATLNNLTSKLFNGNLALSGNVSTKNDTPTFNLDLGAENFDIAESFAGLDMFQSIAPIAKALQGKLNTKLNLKGDLTQDFTPNLNTLFGDAAAELLTTKVEPQNAQVLNKLESSLNFIDFDKFSFNDLKAYLEFANGKVSVKPFTFKYQDIAIEVSGSHGFDKTMAYNAIFNVPAKYLGSDVNKLISSINDSKVNDITVPITANISGSYTDPKVSTDLTSGVKNLTSQLTEIQKQKLIGQGKNELNNLLGGLTGSSTTTKTTTSTDSTTVSETETKTTSQDQIKENVKNVLGGLLGGKKKKTDTLN